MSDAHEFLINLPPEIIIDILSRLPIPTIVSCKCVCRKLLGLISSAAFAEFHLSKPNPGLITDQDLCKIFEFDDGADLQHHNLHYKQLMEFNPRTFITSSNAYVSMEGSVNGLLCLQDESSHLDAFYICNPFTREYTALPMTEKSFQYPDMVVYGFGVSSSSGQYKLVRISHGTVTSSGPSSRNIPVPECLIYTLGTGSWRSIAPGIAFELSAYPCKAFLNGSLHWFVGDADGSSFIACFDLETEMFKPFPGHPLSSDFPIKGGTVILRNCLCICDSSSDNEIVIYMMKEYGIKESWSKEYVISKELGYLGGMSYEAAYPIMVFEDGDMLLYLLHTGLFYYSTKNQTISDKDLSVVVDAPVRVMPILHTPSYVSLKRFGKENVSYF